MGDALANAIGGTTLSASLADSQAQLLQAIGTAADGGSDSLAQFAAAYRASGGGPMLALIGFNPFQIVATGAFHALYWAAIVIFLGITAVVALHRCLVGRQMFSARHPLSNVAHVYFRLMIGALVVANTPLLYGFAMTVNGALSQGVQAMAHQSLGALFQTGSLGTLAFAQARIEAIHQAASRRAIALYPAGASREEMAQIGAWYNALAQALNTELASGRLPGQLPILDESTWSDPRTPDDRVAAYVGRNVVQNFGQLVADLGALPAGEGPLAVAFPSGGSSSLGRLSDSLADDDARAGQAVALPATAANSAAFEAARQRYARDVQADTLAYLDSQLLAVIGASPTLRQRAAAWFSAKVEQAAAAAGGVLAPWRAVVDWIGRGIGVTLTRMAAFVFSAGAGVMIEVDLFVLVLAVPLWLLPATEDAFHGVARSLVGLSIVVPAYQFIMLLIDALMGLVLKYLLFGPLASGYGGATAGAAGAAYTVAAAVATVGSGGEIAGLAMFCYLVAYLFLAIYAAFKTPRLVALFLKGAGAAGLFLSTFATGLISGAAAAVATASVASGGLAGRWAAGSLSARAAAPGAGRQAPGAPRPRPVPAAKVSPAAPEGAPPPASPAPVVAAARSPSTAGETLRFGLRTFVDCLQADTPVDGIEIAFKALESHRRQKEKEAEALHKAREKAEKAAAPTARRARSA